MYLRTPKRYQTRRRRLRLVSRRTLFVLLVIPLAVVAARFIWNNQEDLRSWLSPRIENLAEGVQTQVSVRPTATATPNLQNAQVSCNSNYRQGDLQEAIRQCAILADNSPNDVDIYYRVAHMLVITSNFGRDQDQMERALTYADRTINANPEAPQGWAVRAMALDWLGDYGSALASALHAKALDERFAPTYAFLGEIYHDLGQNDVALGYLEQAIELDTSGIAVADAFRTQGLLYSNQGLYEDAIEPYEIALKQAPNYTYIAIELANNYIALQELDRAIEILNDAVQRNPTDPGVLFALGNAHTRNGNKERSYEYYRRCLDSNPDNVACLSYLGGLMFYDGDYINAINNLEHAIDLGSEDPDDFLQVGQAQAALNRCDLAIPYFQQGYQLSVTTENYDRQAKFASALQDCGVFINQPAPDAVSPAVTPTPGEQQ